MTEPSSAAARAATGPGDPPPHGWTLLDGRLHREWDFPTFADAWAFLSRVAALAEQHDHHPDWSNSYTRVVIDLCSHDRGHTVTARDHRLARAINEVLATTLHSTVVSSPVGPLTLVASVDTLVAVLWEHEDPRRVHLAAVPAQLAAPGAHPVLAEAARQLDEWFAGQRTAFDLPLAVTGTDFQQRAWSFLSTIPHGATRSYRDEAEALGLAQGFQAVGNANRCNPLSIVVPCHRVIGSDGSLTGYAGGIDAKRALLDFEKRVAAGDRTPMAPLLR